MPIAVVAADGQDLTDLVGQAYKIGYERLAGYLAGGMAAWLATGRPQRTTAFVTAERTPPGRYLDVRQASEFAGGHVPGALNVELGSLAEQATDLSGGLLVACGHGERAITAASVLERAGHTQLAVLDGGPAEYAAAHGLHLTGGDGC